MKPEQKFWHELKKSTPKITWTRLENRSAFGTPDLLGYNTNCNFFTVELKVTSTNRVRLSPHQKAVKALSLNLVKLFRGGDVMELDACGLSLAPLRQGLEACRLLLEDLGS